MTEWRAFRLPDFNHLSNQLKDKVIFDFRNLYDPNIAKEEGLNMFIRGHGWFKYKQR